MSNTSLCWRKAVWETRNGEQEIRVIDDMPVSGQNLTARCKSTHMPLASDAYMPIPEDPLELESVNLAQFERETEKLAPSPQGVCVSCFFACEKPDVPPFTSLNCTKLCFLVCNLDVSTLHYIRSAARSDVAGLVPQRRPRRRNAGSELPPRLKLGQGHLLD